MFLNLLSVSLSNVLYKCWGIIHEGKEMLEKKKSSIFFLSHSHIFQDLKLSIETCRIYSLYHSLHHFKYHTFLHCKKEVRIAALMLK